MSDTATPQQPTDDQRKQALANAVAREVGNGCRVEQERAESKRLGNVLNSMTNHPSIRRTGTGYVMPVNTRRGSK